MRKRWALYRFDASPPPDDFAKVVARFWTQRAAVRRQRELGPTAVEWLERHGHGGIWIRPDNPEARYWYRAIRRPKRRLRWWWPWWTFDGRRRWRGWRNR